MNLKSVIPRYYRKLYRPFFQLARRDEITGKKIFPRNDLLHLGTHYGGWIVPSQLLNANSICYCVGCGSDISFNLTLIEKFGCDVFAFDPTPRVIEKVTTQTRDNPKYHFYPIGIWNEETVLRFYAPKNPRDVNYSILNLQKMDEYFEARVARLSQIMRANQHTRIDLLKLDIEGAEYKVLDSIVQDAPDNQIICVEYDECFNPINRHYKNRMRDSMNGLERAGYVLVCAQGDGNYTFVKNA